VRDGNGARYVLGKVPAAGCRTSESVSWVATGAHLTTSTTGMNRYKITAEENVGTGFVVAPAVARAVNSLVITFTSG
jgi:hypothetical protein